MKINRLLTLIASSLIILTLFSGCQQGNASFTAGTDKTVPDNKLFELDLYSDKQIYKTTDKISIWSILEYTGGTDEITIWHGDPYIVYSITDGKRFNLDGVIQDILKSSILKKGTLYRHDYIKSGGYSNDAPDAGFWKTFFAEKDLYLPEGEYIITASCAFSLTQNVIGSEYSQSAVLKIKVVK